VELDVLYKEMYSATLDRLKSTLAVPDTGTQFIDNIDLESNDMDPSSTVSSNTTVLLAVQTIERLRDEKLRLFVGQMFKTKLDELRLF